MHSFWFVLQERMSISSINESNYHYKTNDDHFHCESVSIPTRINAIPNPQFIDMKDSAFFLISNDFQIISNLEPMKDLQLAMIVIQDIFHYLQEIQQ